MGRVALFFLFLLSSSSLFSKGEHGQVFLYLKSPLYEQGRTVTHEGGVIIAGKYRIQARHIVYVDRTEAGEPTEQVFAEGDLMVDDGTKVLVGDRLEYDCLTRTGRIDQGAMGFDFWFLRSSTILFYPDRNLYLFDVSIGTSETKKREWEIFSKKVYVSRERVVEAKQVTVRVGNKPIFYLPFYKNDSSQSADSPARYTVDWDRGPKSSMRYQAYGSKYFQLFFRLDLHAKLKEAKLGVGGAVESAYFSEDGRKKMVNHTYLARDSYFRDSDPDALSTRYRLQGLYKAKNQRENADFHFVYDWMSDKNMPTDFKSRNVEQADVGETKLTMHTQREEAIASIRARPRVNSFQGLKQEFPATLCTLHPFVLGSSGWISHNRVDFAYLDYASAKELTPFLPSFEAARLQTGHELYRPFFYKGLSLTPSFGADFLFYSKSRVKSPEWQGVLRYEFLVKSPLSRHYSYGKHLCTPYFHYQGMVRPTLSPDTPYIFDVRDGYNRLNLIRVGIKNDGYFFRTPFFHPNLSVDLYLYAFFGAQPFSKTIPKAAALFTWNLPSLILTTQLEWNREKELLDLINGSLAWTISQDVACKIEFRHRSAFYWRGNQKENFTMEVTRSIEDLSASPLSDQRNTLLSRLQMKIAPQWILRMESHIGWGRKEEPSYESVKAELLATLFTSWRLSVSYTYTPTPRRMVYDGFMVRLDLIQR